MCTPSLSVSGLSCIILTIMNKERFHQTLCSHMKPFSTHSYEGVGFIEDLKIRDSGTTYYEYVYHAIFSIDIRLVSFYSLAFSPLIY